MESTTRDNLEHEDWYSQIKAVSENIVIDVPTSSQRKGLAVSADRGTGWPAHTQDVRAWQQSSRGGTRADRELREVTVSLPPLIARRTPRISAAVSNEVEHALRDIAELDARHGAQLAGLGVMLLRTESVASSKIEHVEADVADYVRALQGSRANESATAMAAATVALEALVGSVSDGSNLTKKSLLAAHRALMRGDLVEARYAGRVRDVQNWIGGSDHSPRGALFVPPPPDVVDDYLTDLMRFANRDDLSALVQAAVAHAQFESIHPFTDGNGRIGRALVNTVLRRRGFTRTVVVPLASALVARRELYFSLLTRYRDGEVEPIVRAFAVSCAIAAQESTVSAERLAGLPVRWRDAVGGARRGSAVDTLLGRLVANPVVTADLAEELVGGGASTAYRAVATLVDAGVLRPLLQRTRNQVWGVADLLDEMDDLGLRIEVRARDAF